MFESFAVAGDDSGTTNLVIYWPEVACLSTEGTRGRAVTIHFRSAPPHVLRFDSNKPVASLMDSYCQYLKATDIRKNE